jgi:hypothetical protein
VTSQHDLFDVVLAAHPPSSFSCSLHSGQQQANENSNNGDYHQQFDQGESGTDGTTWHRSASQNRAIFTENHSQ